MIFFQSSQLFNVKSREPWLFNIAVRLRVDLAGEGKGSGLRFLILSFSGWTAEYPRRPEDQTEEGTSSSASI